MAGALLALPAVVIALVAGLALLYFLGERALFSSIQFSVLIFFVTFLSLLWESYRSIAAGAAASLFLSLLSHSIGIWRATGLVILCLAALAFLLPIYRLLPTSPKN